MANKINEHSSLYDLLSLQKLWMRPVEDTYISRIFYERRSPFNPSGSYLISFQRKFLTLLRYAKENLDLFRLIAAESEMARNAHARLKRKSRWHDHIGHTSPEAEKLEKFDDLSKPLPQASSLDELVVDGCLNFDVSPMP